MDEFYIIKNFDAGVVNPKSFDINVLYIVAVIISFGALLTLIFGCLLYKSSEEKLEIEDAYKEMYKSDLMIENKSSNLFSH